MFELFFVIGLSNGQIIREYWPDNFVTQQECKVKGWDRTESFSQQIIDKYPEMISFNISCEQKNTTT